MVLNVMKYNIHPDKLDAYQEWAKSAIPQVLAMPGVVEFRGYRPASGAWQVVVTTEFTDLAAWAAATSSGAWQQINSDLHTLALDITTDVWGPSPVMPEPLRP